MLSPLQKILLESLIEYGQLTIPQFAFILNGENSNQSIRRALNALLKRRKPLVNRVEFEKISHFGKLHYVYSITVLGLKLYEQLINNKIDKIVFTPNNPKLTEDYFHRTTTIDFHILIKKFEQAENYTLEFCTPYFIVKRNGQSFVSINKIDLGNGKSIIPDLVACLRKDGRERFLLFELHNGKDKNRIKEQIKQHALCLTNLHTHSKYGIQNNRFYYILLVFEHESVSKSVIEDLSNDIWYREIGRFFLCKTIEQTKDSMLEGWTNIKGNNDFIEY